MTSTNSAGRFEIVGPSGVGKTTVYNEICKHWRETSPWIYLEKLRNSTNPKLSGNFKKWFSLHIKNMFKVPSKFGGELGTKFIEENQRLVSVIWKLLEQNNGNKSKNFDFRLRTAHNIYKDFERIQFIREINDPRPCLIVEGLLQKGYLRGEIHNSMNNALQDYLTFCPLPLAVFILKTDSIEEIVIRKTSRQKRNAGENKYDHNDFTKSVIKWQNYFDALEKKLIHFGVNVHRINASRSVKESANEIIEIMERTGNKRSAVKKAGFLTPDFKKYNLIKSPKLEYNCLHK
jgi:ABC-type oligopeptide transport system ATPase subunit